MSLTKLAGKGPLVRQTDAFDRNDPLIVTLHPKHLEIRVKYKGEGYALSYRAILCMEPAATGPIALPATYRGPWIGTWDSVDSGTSRTR